MAEFYYDNLAKNLPDAYQKSETSNNYKILEIERDANGVLRSLLDDIASVIDIDRATGTTLDLYGKRFGQSRGKATDAQYIAMIKSKIIRALCNGSYKNIVDAICYTFGCDADSVWIAETDTPMTVRLEKAPLDKIIKAGFSAEQAQKIVKNLLPVTVTLEYVNLEGTFEFSEIENEYDENAGFSDVEDGEIGGFFGWVGSAENGEVLPI